MNKQQRRGMAILAIVFLVVAVGIMVQQFITWQHGWEWTDFLHHENFAAIFGASAFTIFVVLLVLSRKRR